MLNKSIAYRLSIYISIAVIGVFIAFIVIFFFFDSKNITNNIENRAIGLSSEVSMQVGKELVATQEITSNISKQIIFYAQQDQPELLISGILKKYQFLNAIHVTLDSVVHATYHNYFGFRDQDSIQFEQQNFEICNCLGEKQIMEEFVLNKRPGWSEVYKCPQNGNMVVSFYSPIQFQNGKNSSIVGWITCELSLKELNNTINKIKIGENGFAILLSKDGRYLAHPNKEWIYTKSIFSVSDDVYDKKKIDYKEVLNKGLSGSLIAYPEFRNNEKYWGYYTRLKEIEWTLVIAVPYNELFEPLYHATLKMLFFSVLGILVIFFIISYITSRLVEPLNTVTTQLKRFSNLSGEADISTLNEVDQVSESLNYLKSWYKKFKIKQSQDEKSNQRRMEDLLEASEIQRSLIKTDFSEISKRKEINLYAIYKPARIVSGDLFDYFLLDNEHLLFTMGDVSGKGVPAAFFMSVAQTIIKSSATLTGVNTIVKKANNELYTNNGHQFFLTLFLGVLNLKTGVLSFCNAAHTPTYILKFNGEIIELAQAHGLPLGLYFNKQYSYSTITIEKGDSIILYTDGITDLQSENKIHYGNERFVENLRHLVGSGPKNIVDSIEKSLETFEGEAEQADDITLMVIQYST